MSGAAICAALATAIVASGCRGRLEDETKEIIRFDFEQSGWLGQVKRITGDAHSGSYSSRVDAKAFRTTAWSPLIPLDGVRALQFSWWSLLELPDGGNLSLWAHFYSESDLSHPAIPDLPRKQAGRRLQHVTEPHAEWTPTQAQLDEQQVPRNATWLRIELRLFPGSSQTARLLIDDFHVLARRVR